MKLELMRKRVALINGQTAVNTGATCHQVGRDFDGAINLTMQGKTLPDDDRQERYILTMSLAEARHVAAALLNSIVSAEAMIEENRDMLAGRAPCTCRKLMPGMTCKKHGPKRQGNPCPKCHGQGRVPFWPAGGIRVGRCDKCDGTGVEPVATAKVEATKQNSRKLIECPNCQGDGGTIDRTCSVCGGTGEIAE